MTDEGTWLPGVEVAFYTQDVTETERAGLGDVEEPAYRGQAKVGTSMTRAGSGRLRDIRYPSREVLLCCRPTGTAAQQGPLTGVESAMGFRFRVTPPSLQSLGSPPTTAPRFGSFCRRRRCFRIKRPDVTGPTLSRNAGKWQHARAQPENGRMRKMSRTSAELASPTLITLTGPEQECSTMAPSAYSFWKGHTPPFFGRFIQGILASAKTGRTQICGPSHGIKGQAWRCWCKCQELKLADSSIACSSSQ